MRLAARTFISLFLPLLVLLPLGFWTVERSIEAEVHGQLRGVLREHEQALLRLQAQNEEQNQRSLRVLAENSALKAGLQILMSSPGDPQAIQTVREQLRDIATITGLDMIFVSGADSVPGAGVVRHGQTIQDITWKRGLPPSRGLYVYGDAKFQVTSIPVSMGDEVIGLLSVGLPVDFRSLSTPVVLTYAGKVVESTVPQVSAIDIGQAISHCPAQRECDFTLKTGEQLSVAQSLELGGGYGLRRVTDVGAALRPVRAVIEHISVVAAVLTLLSISVLTWLSSRVIVGPIRRIVRHLRESERAGTLQAFDADAAAATEIRELMEGFNRAAAAIRAGQDQLHTAYLQSVESLANALDARDPYTAGHSARVARYSTAVAEALDFDREALRNIGVGALLHDIGKIGIPDAVLGKPGRLSEEEFSLIKQHPAIGKRILEGVQGFSSYLDVVELHHENWDGTGYPRGLRAEQVPLSARIVHVADAYDAMTSDRPYRSGMTPTAALRILRENAGTQFDPAVVATFVSLQENALTAQSLPPASLDSSILQLAGTLRSFSAHSSDPSSKEVSRT